MSESKFTLATVLGILGIVVGITLLLIQIPSAAK